MPKRNYGFEKRQKELKKQEKREEKRQKKLDRPEGDEGAPTDGIAGDTDESGVPAPPQAS